MIPKTIHYCWFGGNKMPKLAKKCIKSWKKKCPDYEIICWNEKNFDINKCPLYVRQAYENKKWAFVTDYVRLKIIYEQGGIYLDTDVEVLKNFDEFLKYEAFFGIEDAKYINTGCGFGAVSKNDVVKEIMEQYNTISFIKEDKTFDIIPCTMRNTEIFLKHGFKLNDEFQLIKNNIAIFPSEFFSPINYITKEKKITQNTCSIHWFSASWIPWKIKIKKRAYEILKNIIGKENLRRIKKLNGGRKSD